MISALHGPNAVRCVPGRHWPAAQFDEELFALLLLPGFRRFLFVRLEDAQPAALGLGVQPGQRLAQRQGFIFPEAEALGNDGGPEGQDRGTVGGDGFHVGNAQH
jgi:hypothetical protein